MSFHSTRRTISTISLPTAILILFLSLSSPSAFAYSLNTPAVTTTNTGHLSSGDYAFAELFSPSSLYDDAGQLHTFSFNSDYGTPPNQAGKFQVNIDWASRLKNFASGHNDTNTWAFTDLYTLNPDSSKNFIWDGDYDHYVRYENSINEVVIFDHSEQFEAVVGETYYLQLSWAASVNFEYGAVQAESKLYRAPSFTILSEEQPPPAVPEPTTILLLGTGLIGLAGARRRLRK